MSTHRMPKRLKQEKRLKRERSFPGHRAWVRRHQCSVPGCEQLPIECAHVRRGTDGGEGLKPSDKWSISLCGDHHLEQHRIGEISFEKKYQLDLIALAEAFANRSPHRHRWSW